MEIYNIHIKLKERLVGIRIRGISVYRISKRILRIAFVVKIIKWYCWYKYHISNKDYMICNKVNNDIYWRTLQK